MDWRAIQVEWIYLILRQARCVSAAAAVPYRHLL